MAPSLVESRDWWANAWHNVADRTGKNCSCLIFALRLNEVLFATVTRFYPGSNFAMKNYACYLGVF